MFGAGEVLIIVIAICIIYFVFGKNLPKISKDAGIAVREFNKALKEPKDMIADTKKELKKGD